MQVTIEKLIYGGDGLARLPAEGTASGKAAFVPFVLAGEEIDVSVLEDKRSFARARADHLLRPSLHRVGAGCKYFQHCGGCHYQHADYDHQLEIKAAILKENLRRIAKLELDCELQVHASPPWNHRNRTRLKVRTEPDFAIGYYRFNSHELLSIEQCPISSPLINSAITAFWKLGATGEVPRGLQEVEFFADPDDAKLLLELHCAPNLNVGTAKRFANELQIVLPELAGTAIFREMNNRNAGEPEMVASVGATHLTYRTERSLYRVTAGAFFQVNRHLTDELVSIVTGNQKGGAALDLYAGVGLFSTALAQTFQKVTAVESSPTSFDDLRYNSPVNVKAVRAMSGQYLKKVRSLRPDLVVVDPPRSGLGKSVVHSLVTLGAPHLTYVSCDPATLSRDLGGLLRAGYEVHQAHLVDLFPQTYHLESVFHLVR